jgi:hypothetical protein
MNNDLLSLFAQVPDETKQKYKDYEKALHTHLKENNFLLFSKELADARAEKGYYYMEQNFFSDLLLIANKYIDNLPDIEFLPRRYFDFATSREFIEGRNIIIADELVNMFLTRFSCVAFYSSMNTEEAIDIKAINRMFIGVIDTLVCRNVDISVDGMIEIITKYENATKYACLFSRAMYSYYLCHEIAHIALNHTENTKDNEYEADALAYEIFYATILNRASLKHLEFFQGLRRAPLALFDILDTVEYFKTEILDQPSNFTTHPEPFLRKAALLNQFDFGDDVESFNLYLVVSEKAVALKHYINKYKGALRVNIEKIHKEDTSTR